MNDGTKRFPSQRGSALWLSLVLAALCILAAPPATAQVTGVSYTLSPVGQRMLWEDNAGLDDGYLYGGEVGFGFGRYLQIGALYQLGNDFETDFSDFDAGGDAPIDGAVQDALGALDARDVDIRRYGGQVRLNLGSGGIIPFATVGAGVIQFDPDGLDDSRNIYGSVGAGLTFAVADRYTLSVGGEMLSYRYNPATTFLTDDDLDQINTDLGEGGFDPLARGDFEEQTVYNPSLRAALRLYLGGRDPDELTELDRAFLQQFRGGGLRLFVEPFYGRVEFNEALGFAKDQNLAGINAGIELGPYVGLRGFYWRGTTGDDVFDEFAEDFEDIAFYGGELNLRFGGAGLGQQGFVPYGILGGGYMDVLSGYDDDLPEGATSPDSRYFASAGGGVEIPLSSALKLQGDARYLFMSNEDVEDVDDPSDVYGSLMYSAGIELSFGGGGGRTPEEILRARAEEREARAQARVEAERAERMRAEEAMQERMQALQAQIDSLEEAQQQQAFTDEREEEIETLREEVQQLEEEQERRPARMVAEQERMEQDRMEQQDRQRRRVAQGPASNLSGETIVVPVPERGEIYIRFGEGPDGEVTTQTEYAPPTVVMPQGGAVQQQGVQPPAERGAAPGGAALSDEDIRQIVRETIREELQGISTEETGQLQVSQLQDQLSQLERRLTQRIQAAEDEARRAGEQRTTTPDIQVETGGEETQTETRILGDRYAPNRVVPTAGYAVGDAERFLFGVRGDYGSPDAFDVGSYGFRFMPELMVGLGDGVSLDLIANGVIDIGAFQASLPEGLGPYAGAGLGLSTEAGLGINLLLGTEYDVGGGAIFGEFSTLDFFDYNRFLIGYRTRF